ncbi:MAG: DsrE/DsrF/DrsH-like family protein, partial [Hydrogenovibrio sp.]|nr:DsrE/DsrF/DrsH-like family protein [Hydrogenovibrio sp.]
PVGPGWLRRIDWNSVLPQLVWVLPGMTALATKGFRKTMAQQNQLPFEELRQLCLDMGVKFTVCTMAYDLLGMDQDDLIEGVEFAGAATYFANSPRSQSLFI